MTDMTMQNVADAINDLGRQLAAERAMEDERLAKLAFRRWLRPRLRWLVDYPALLRLYLRLPHRCVPVLEHHPDGRRRIVLGERIYGTAPDGSFGRLDTAGGSD